MTNSFCEMKGRIKGRQEKEEKEKVI